MPKNWKYIKKFLEKEFLCENLRGHITYDLTQYEPAPWYQHHFVMKHDDVVLLEAQMGKYDWSGRYDGQIDSYSVGKRLSDKLHEKMSVKNDTGMQDDIYRISMELAEDTLEHIAHYDGTYGVGEIVEAISVYLHSDIKTSLESDDYFIRAVAILDRRCGKRTLQRLAEETRIFDIPQWLKRIYRIRFEAEKIKYTHTWGA